MSYDTLGKIRFGKHTFILGNTWYVTPKMSAKVLRSSRVACSRSWIRLLPRESVKLGSKLSENSGSRLSNETSILFGFGFGTNWKTNLL